MREWLVIATEQSVTVIDGMALVIIVIGTMQAFFTGAWVMLHPAATGHERRAVWVRYARWLVAGLTFQLAADIIETAIAPTWDDIGRLAAIAAIRTGLNFFLERDVEEVRERQQTEARS